MSERIIEDDVLIRRAQTGDRAAFDLIVAKYQVRAYHFAYRLTRNEDEASDIVAEAFVRCFVAIDRFKGNSSFATWLYRIMTNCFLDIKKKEKTRKTTSLDTGLQGEGEMEMQIEDDRPSPQEETFKTAQADHIQTALGKMPEYQRTMIVMYHMEMMSYEEIAATLDLPVGTVKSRLNRARLLLRDLLIKNEELFRA